MENKDLQNENDTIKNEENKKNESKGFANTNFRLVVC